MQCIDGGVEYFTPPNIPQRQGALSQVNNCDPKWFSSESQGIFPPLPSAPLVVLLKTYSQKAAEGCE